MDSLTHSHSKQYTFIHITVSLKVRPTVFQISKIFGSWHFFKGNKFPGHNTNDERRRKRKKKKRGKRRREEKDLVIQGRAELVLGRLGFGPSWFRADLVLGRVGFGPTWFGPSWFWAELTREQLQLRMDTLSLTDECSLLIYWSSNNL